MDEFEVGPIERSWGKAIEEHGKSSCLSASDLLEFVEGSPDSTVFAKGVAHLSECSACRQIVQEMRSANEFATVAPWWSRFPLTRPALYLGSVAGLLLAAVGLWAVMAAPGHLSGRNIQSEFVATRSRQGSTEANLGSHSPNSRHSQADSASTATRSLLSNSAKPLTSIPSNETQKAANDKSSLIVSAAQKPRGPASTAQAQTDDSSAQDTQHLYALVGSDGVFALPSKEAKQVERQQIEQQYADAVSSANRSYAESIQAHQAPELAGADLDGSLKTAADTRDRQLGALFPRQDDLLANNPALKVEGDAPYQVVELVVRRHSRVRQAVSYVVYPPWPGYTSSDTPFGWSYSHAYRPTELRKTYLTWRQAYSHERTAFHGLVGTSGEVHPSLLRGSRSRGYSYASRAEGLANAADQASTGRRSGYTHSETPDPNLHLDAPQNDAPAAQNPPRHLYTHEIPVTGHLSEPSESSYTHSLLPGPIKPSGTSRPENQTDLEYNGSRTNNLEVRTNRITETSARRTGYSHASSARGPSKAGSQSMGASQDRTRAGSRESVKSKRDGKH